MARGRMINKRITLDKRIHNLSNDTSRLAFTWLVTFADVEGRVHGDPGIVRSMLFPRRDDVSIEEIESYIFEWAALGLIEWYEADDDLYIYFINFHKNQDLRPDREAPSSIPAPPISEALQVVTPENGADNSLRNNSGTSPDQLRSNSGATPEPLPVKLKEKKLKEKKLKEENDIVVGYIGLNYPFIWKRIKEMLKGEMPESGFQKVEGTEVFDVQDRIVRIRAPTENVDWLNDRLGSTVNRILQGYTSEDFSIEFIAGEDP